MLCQQPVAVVGLGLRRDVGVGADHRVGVDAIGADDRLDVHHDPAHGPVGLAHAHDDVADRPRLAQRHRNGVRLARERRPVAVDHVPRRVDRRPAQHLVHREAQDAGRRLVRGDDRAVGRLDDDALTEGGESRAVERLGLLDGTRPRAEARELVLPRTAHAHPIASTRQR